VHCHRNAIQALVEPCHRFALDITLFTEAGGEAVTLTMSQALYGAPIPPSAHVRLLSPTDFELLVKEWVKTCKNKYFGHEHFGGGGDMGRDVAGWLDKHKCLGVWDNYQCKRLGDPLTPTDIWPELGKIFWHVSLNDYVMPREMRFFCSSGIGTKAKHLFSNADKLRTGLITNWSKCVENHISTTAAIPLTSPLLALIQATDFTIFGSLSVDQVLDDIKSTAFYISKFGGGFPSRPAAIEPPVEVLPHEANYTEQLLAVYGERLSKAINQLSDLPPGTFERKHFNQMRRQFYSAEALSEFVRELTEQGTFVNFQQDILNAVWPVLSDDHPTSFNRLQKTLSSAAGVPQSSNAIYLVAEALDKQGVCHQLANVGQLDWKGP
jgi:hypothetical protein